MSRATQIRKKLRDYDSLDIDSFKVGTKPLLDRFIRRTAVITLTDESITDKIIRHQWEEANKRVGQYNTCSAVEIACLGTLRLSEFRADKRIKSMEDYITKASEDLPTSDNKDKLITNIANLSRDMESIKRKRK